MRKIVRLTESDLTRIVRRVIKEESESSYPNNIEVKILDNWKKDSIYGGPRRVTVYDDKYTYIGNTKLSGFGGVIYFATFMPKIKEIQTSFINLEFAEPKINKNQFDQLMSEYPLDSKYFRKIIEHHNLRLAQDAYYKFNDLEPGSVDHRESFEIV